MDESENATAKRMARQASESLAEKAQETVDEVADTHAEKAHHEVKEALKETWSDKQEATTPPLPDDKADEYAEHISEGHQITVVPVEPKLAPEDS
ncbi:MAG: hypothetical protein ABI251_14175 [Mycobacteriaceae bacterium]